jgi:hypothetical protein
MIPGETIATGASPTCSECHVTPKLEILQSPIGFYIGTMCNCGPYSRESDYYRSRTDAEIALKAGTYGR